MASAAKYGDLRAETSSAFDKLGSFLADLCDGTEDHHEPPEKPNLDTNLGSFYETFTALKARHADQNLTVAVLALTKSGKSTLLNALIGASCLPANNVPETARITRITHTVGQAELVDNTTGQSKVVTGEEDIKAYLQYLNSEVRMRDHQLSDETYLDLKIPIAALRGYDDECRARDVTIGLLDTPGPNEAGEVALKAQVERLLDSVDAVIYLLDYTKLKTADEAEILQRLKEINPQLMARLSQRLFFVVNKADMIETSEGLDAEATKQYVADLITHQMQDESFQLKPDQVLLVSAQHALLSRLVLQGKADKHVASRFGRLAFGSRANKFPPHEHRVAAGEMLIASGLAELEETVLAFLYAHSGSLKMLALLDDIVRMLHQIKNVAAASNAALQRDVAFLQKETQEMQSKLEKSLQSFDTVQQEAQAVEGEVVDEVQQRMHCLKEKLFRDVTNVLEPSRQHPQGRWQEAWHRAGRFLNRRPGHSQAHQLELQNKLYELHAAISSSIEAEVRDFWQDVEAATNERQRAMFQCINRRLESLSRQIEATVGEALDLRLEPITIAMDPPAAQDFHDSLQNLFAQGIRQRSVTRNRRRQQAYTVWEPRFQNGLCRTGQYFVGRPASRHVTEQYEQPVYELQPEHIKEYFIALVDGTVEASVKYVREYVHAYLSDMLEEARSQIHSYGQSFSATMQAALITRQQGEEARSAALQVTTARLASINSLLRDVAAIQRHAEQLCPGQHPISDVMSEFSLDEPESSSHAVHAEPDAASSHGASAVADTSSQNEQAFETANAQSGITVGRSGNPIPIGSGAAPAELAVSESRPASNHSLPEAVASTSADAVSDSEAPVEPEGLLEGPLPAVAPRASDRLTEESQESPLPGIMNELQQAMTASISSTGSAHENFEGAFEGAPLDEETELELAVFLSLQDAAAQAVGAAVEEAAAPEAESEAEAESADSESGSGTESADSESEAESAESDIESAESEIESDAESAVFAAVAQAESAAIAAAAQAEAAAMAAATQAESAATAAAAQAESTVMATAAQAESAAIAHATAAASTVAAHVEAAARSVDAALNHQAASVRGTMLSLADHLDGWWPRRPSSQQRGPGQRGFQQRGPQLASLQRGPWQAGIQQRGPQQAGLQQRGPQQGGQAHSTAPASNGQSSVQADSPAPSTHESDASQQEEAELAEAAEQMQTGAQESAPRLSRIHSVSSDDSSFDLTEAPAATPALPIDQFAALSLLDFDSEVPHFEDLDAPQSHHTDDSPFDVHSEDHEGRASSHISTGHAGEDLIDDVQAVPDLLWDVTDGDQDSDVQIQDDAPVTYPQISGTAFSSSLGSESPVHYPQVHRPIHRDPGADDTHQAQQPISPRVDRARSPSPRTQMHLTALGSDAFTYQSSESGDDMQHIGMHEAGDMTPAGESAAWPLEAEEIVEPLETAAGIHVQQDHEEVGRLAALSGHAEMIHDSDEWELVSSDLDEELG